VLTLGVLVTVVFHRLLFLLLIILSSIKKELHMNMFSRKLWIFLLLVLTILGCSTSIDRNRAAIPVVVSNHPVAGAAKSFGLVVGTDGSGCGLLGRKGNKENSIYNLKVNAHALGANFVHVTKETPPHSIQGCAVNEYVIEGNAYKTIPLEEQEEGLIAIKNAGFEDDPLGKNGVSKTWHYGLKEWSGNKGGVVNVMLNDGMFPMLGAPEGENMAFLAYAGSYIEQKLDFLLAPNRVYNLTVSVGHRSEKNFEDGDYAIELRAGSTILSEKRAALPGNGEIEEVSISYISPHSSDKLGKPIVISLKNISARQVNFDNVRLSNQIVRTK
jgi:hypothetical protein